jgi:uncharacterized spore protein YtfJ
MTDPFSNVATILGSRNEQSREMLEKLLAAAQPGAVYSQPVAHGEYTVITASEVAAGGGFGFGMGFGAPSAARPGEVAQEQQGNGGGGSGGGGGSSGRPVAVIVIGPAGVEVKPVLDVTKIGLAALTTWGAMLVTLRKMRKR